VPTVIEALTGVNLIQALQSLPGVGQGQQEPPAEG